MVYNVYLTTALLYKTETEDDGGTRHDFEQVSNFLTAKSDSEALLSAERDLEIPTGWTFVSTKVVMIPRHVLRDLLHQADEESLRDRGLNVTSHTQLSPDFRNAAAKRFQ